MIAVACRRALRPVVLPCVGSAHVLQPVSGEQLRAWLHRITPRVLVVDEAVGERKWKVMAALPRVHLVASQPRIILLTNKLDSKRELQAAMAGCFDAVDVTSSSWPQELREAVRIALRGVRPYQAEGSPPPPASCL
jgi:DNA-binding response OmpR family regulator